jgi:hypothetical protein
MKIGSVLLIALLLLVGCSSKAAPPPKHFDQLKVSYKPYGQPVVERQIPIVFVLDDASTTAYTNTGESPVKYGEHWLCFGNYDLSENPNKPNTKILQDVPAGSDIEPIKACLTIKDKEGTSADTPLQPGTYIIGLTNKSYDAIVNAGIYWDKGKLGCQSNFQLRQMKGQLRLDSVSENDFSGEVDLSDGENSMVATFSGKAKIRKNHVPLY